MIQNPSRRQLLLRAALAGVVPSGLSATARSATLSQVTISQWSPPSTFNVLTAADQYAYQDIALMFASLTRLDDSLRPVPELAKSWEVSPDGLTYVFHLDPAAKWHDGHPVTATDVAYTFDMIANPAIPAGSFSSFASIQGLAEVNSGKQDHVSGIKVIDDHTVSITLMRLDVTFLSKLAKSLFRTSGILPSHLLSDTPASALASHPFWRSPVGSGPFKFVRYRPGQFLELAAFDDYVLGRPKIDRLFMRIGTQDVLLAQLQRGEVDFAQVPPTEYATLKAARGIELVEKPSITFQAIYPNDTKPYLKDRRIRQALYHAIDRGGIVTALLQGHGEAVVTPIAAPAWAVDTDVMRYDYNPARARQLLAEAGWDADRVLNIRFGTGNAVRDAEAPVLQQAFAEIGVKSQLNSTDFPTMVKDMQSGSFDLALVGHMSGDDPDYTAIWSASASAPPRGNNFMRYSNPEVDKLLAEGRSTSDQGRRKQIYDAYQKIIVEDVCMIWLFRANDIFGTTNRVRGFKPGSGADPFWNIHEWSAA